uniref:Transposase of IS652 n=1 Tax=uncultured Thiotrichaceae bacterium TaxID=298394 RepID=A0A6S6UCU8_9GAMM|nr:MAG: Transposase of IS652 [uncultured Thiotrichaceae bacterium]
MWTLRKAKTALNADDKRQLKRLFSHSPDLKQAYQLSQQLTRLFNAPTSRSGGIRRLKNRMRTVNSSELKCFDTFLGTLETWLEEIANYFVARENSGFVEGLNNRIKVIKRRCYGLVNKNHLFQRITLELSGGDCFA